MSIAEIERFAGDLKSNAALRAEAEKALADKSQANPMARGVAFAASKGYAFTADEMKELAKAEAKAAGKELTDAQLDGVAGGANPLAGTPQGAYLYAVAGPMLALFGIADPATIKQALG